MMLQLHFRKSEYKGIIELVEAIKVKLAEHVEGADHNVELWGPEGEGFHIDIAHPKGEEWGKEEIRVNVTYFGSYPKM
jgi:hypothetical protein